MTSIQEQILNKSFEKFDASFQDEAKYQAEYLPKVAAYLKLLHDAQPVELQLSKDLLPLELDSVFDAVDLVKTSGALSAKELEITELPAVELLARIADKKYTAVEVFKAYSHRAVIGNQLTNFALEFFIDEGLLKAEALDKHLESTGSTVGPLHGLPLSLKEHIAYKGKIQHQSTVSNIDNIPLESAPILDIFEKLGCVYYVRTSQPQTIMHLDTDNNIIGRTRNPYNLAISPGGSSGGEGACVAIGGSPMGIGSDIGGSIRGPALFSGCWGLKPTSRRIYGQQAQTTSGNESVVPTFGPLARTVEDLDLFMDAYINSGKPWTVDPWALPFPWRKVEVPKASDLKIGILWDDGIVKPFPPIERGLKYVADKLEKAGVTVVDFELKEAKLLYDVVHAFYTLDGNYAKRIALGKSGEPLLPLTKWYMSYGDGDKTLTFPEIQKLTTERDRLREVYLHEMNKLGVDVVLCPASFNVAAPPQKVFYWGYTSLWNILDMPGIGFPTGLRQDPAIDTKIEGYEPRNELEQLELPNYDDPSLFKGAPISLQLVGRRYFDEEVVAAAKLIDQILKA